MPCRYAKTDAASLAYLRRELLRPRYSATETAVGVTVVGTVAAGLFLLLDVPVAPSESRCGLREVCVNYNVCGAIGKMTGQSLF